MKDSSWRGRCGESARQEFSADQAFVISALSAVVAGHDLLSDVDQLNRHSTVPLSRRAARTSWRLPPRAASSPGAVCPVLSTESDPPRLGAAGLDLEHGGPAGRPGWRRRARAVWCAAAVSRSKTTRSPASKLCSVNSSRLLRFVAAGICTLAYTTYPRSFNVRRSECRGRRAEPAADRVQNTHRCRRPCSNLARRRGWRTCCRDGHLAVLLSTRGSPFGTSLIGRQDPQKVRIRRAV